ncbi:metal tolerance protein 2 [Cornus florida]|uniref:metal tolerance protein 2 n=1 Tax=Cornus florida TaxID=4283 RepID=UPI0028974D6D|nr:metal tolerance protein 2 [Cornus florida]
MRFRFFNFNPICRTYISRISSSSHNSLNVSTHNPLIQALNPHMYDFSPVHPENPNYKIYKRWHLGHSHHHHQDYDRSGKEGEKVFRLGLAADIGLAAGKALTGYLSGSTAVIADAAHSLSDVVLSGVALLSFKAARVPKDKEHPYGHGKFETLGALGISCMLLATAGGIAWHALDILLGLVSAAPDIGNQLAHDHVHGHHHGGHHHGIDMEHPILALNMTIVSICIKEGLYWITKRAGERQGSGLMKANAWHHRADAVSSLVALIGVGGSILGVKFLDPLAGVFVSGMILKAGLQTGYQSVLELVDAAVPSELLDPFKQTILQVEGVKGWHHLRGRRAGSSLYLDVIIEVDPFLSVSAAHDVDENVRRQIQKYHPEVAEVFIHIEPAISQILPSTMDRQSDTKGSDYQNGTASPEHKEIENIIANILLSKFGGKMVVDCITHHTLQGKSLLEIEVSMPPDVLIRDAMEMAEEAEKDILRAASNIVQVYFQLRLGHSKSQYHQQLLENNRKESRNDFP